jgi:hypothetical protein
MLGAGSQLPIDVTRLRIHWFIPVQELIRWFPLASRQTCQGAKHDNFTRQWGKSFADDFARTGYCKH